MSLDNKYIEPTNIEELLFAELYISDLSFKCLMPGDEVVDKHGSIIASYPEPWWEILVRRVRGIK